jgi:predicted P-loop ATPase
VINANSLTTDQWRRVFFELLNQPESLFNNQYQDCPLCSSAGDFKGREMDPGYHMVCNSCGGLDGKGGMITQLGFSERILGVDRNTAKYRIAQFLGLPQPQQQLLDQLQELPVSWGLVAVDGNKRPYQQNWQANPLTKEQAAVEVQAGRAKAIGVIAGPVSDGLLFLDHDGISATEQLEKLGIPLSSLPTTAICTSGRDGRFQALFTVPKRYWPQMRNRRVFDTGKVDADGKAEQLDLRWNRHQSVVIGAHPITGGYRWIKHRSPAEAGVSEATEALINLLIDPPEHSSTPLLTAAPPMPGTVPLLDFITKDSRTLIETGGTPGRWNDDQLRLALDLQGTEQWIIAQGHRPDISAAEAFDRHISAAQTQAKDFDARKAQHRFEGAAAQNPHPGTPADKLESRLRFHTRTSRPALPLRPSSVLAFTDAKTIGELESELKEARSALKGLQPSSPDFDRTKAKIKGLAKQVSELNKGISISPGKLLPVDAAELLAMLRTQAGADRIRFNRFSQQIEMNGKTMEGVERFYLSLAEQGYKVTKELAVDCLVQVAHERPYDPVQLYLEHVAATVEPAYISGLATAYLRPEDSSLGGPTLYDEMIRCTLIGAVRRAFEPGCKHDTACVLMGDQGARKSSFWGALGGAFFSDALRDISSKDDLMVLHRSWIMEWAELDHIMGRKHAGQVKAFLSQSTDLFRVPYGKATEAFPRRCIIVGSTNRSTGFLVDDTGNRRFWVIPTTRTEADPIDTPTLMAERNAIWSAAVHAYRDGAANYLPPEMALKVTEENETYQVENPWKAPILAWLAQPVNHGSDLTSEAILCKAIAKPIERQTRSDQMQVAAIMRDLGYGKTRKSVEGDRQWVFVKD